MKHALRGQVAIVTGGAGGVGRATALRLLRRGCSVELWDIDHAAVEEAARQLGCEPVVVDVTDAKAIARGVEAALERHGRIDILVNNAGHMAPGDFLDQPAAVWHTTVNINVTAIIDVTHAVLPHLYNRGSGHVVNISSAAGLVGVSGLAVYSATKWAVWGLTEALRHEARNHGKPGVRFSSVHPNYIAKGMFEGARIRGVGGIVFPVLKSHDVVAKAIVEGALIRRRRTPKRPRSLRMAILLRGILPDAWFGGIARALNVHRSMQSWKGRE